MTPKKLSRKTGVGEQTIRLMVGDRLLPAVREGGRWILGARSTELINYLLQRTKNDDEFKEGTEELEKVDSVEVED